MGYRDTDKWDTFFRFPPCGTVVEIESSAAMSKKEKMIKGHSGEHSVSNIASLGCVECHMPVVKRALDKIDIPDSGEAASVEAVVKYHLLDENRRQRIVYENKTPIAYDVFRQKIALEMK